MYHTTYCRHDHVTAAEADTCRMAIAARGAAATGHGVGSGLTVEVREGVPYYPGTDTPYFSGEVTDQAAAWDRVRGSHAAGIG